MKKCTWIFALILLISGSAFADQVFDVGARAPEGYSGGSFDRSICELTCPPNTIQENEPDCFDGYRDSTNNGCNCNNWSPPTICAFSQIECGDTVCGKSGTYLYTESFGIVSNYRDTDWYRLVLTSPSTIVWSAYAEFPVQLLIISAGDTTCTDSQLSRATGESCELTIARTLCMPPGVYYLWIGPNVYEGIPCGSDYYAWVNCEPCTICDPTDIVRFVPDVTPNCQCVDLCPGTITQIWVCGTSAYPPAVHILPGCFYSFPYCNEECPPAQFGYNPQNWFFDPTRGCWVNYIIGFTPGCVCVCFDRWLPVELSGFDAIAGNGSVTIRWSTASESNSDHFVIIRNGALITRVPAAGSSTTTHNYSYTDRAVENGVSYTYTLRSVDVNGATEDHGTVNATPQGQSAAQVTEFALHQNFPNPFNPNTSIAFDLAEASFVTLKVYNLAGQEVASLVSGSMNAGNHTINFNGSSLASGVYLYRLTAGSFSADRKMLLMK